MFSIHLQMSEMRIHVSLALIDMNNEFTNKIPFEGLYHLAEEKKKTISIKIADETVTRALK